MGGFFFFFLNSEIKLLLCEQEEKGNLPLLGRRAVLEAEEGGAQFWSLETKLNPQGDC